MNVLIPMAGRGNRFVQAGYSIPKPLIPVNEKTMIERSIESVSFLSEERDKFIFLVLKEHVDNFKIDTYLKNKYKNCNIIVVNEITEGAACTALLAKEFINNNEELFIMNSDQIITFFHDTTWKIFNACSCCDGFILCDINYEKDPIYSYVKCNTFFDIFEVAEKNKISDFITTGHYWWKKGSDFVKYTESMIEKNIRTNNEFYICPVFNEAIQDKKMISMVLVKDFYCLGTPEKLEKYLLENKNE